MYQNLYIIYLKMLFLIIFDCSLYGSYFMTDSFSVLQTNVVPSFLIIRNICIPLSLRFSNDTGCHLPVFIILVITLKLQKPLATKYMLSESLINIKKKPCLLLCFLLIVNVYHLFRQLSSNELPMLLIHHGELIHDNGYVVLSILNSFQLQFSVAIS